MDELERTLLTRVKAWGHGFFFNVRDIDEINKWCEQNCQGAYRINQQYIQFNDDRDAVLYSLKWLSR